MCFALSTFGAWAPQKPHLKSENTSQIVAFSAMLKKGGGYNHSVGLGDWPDSDCGVGRGESEGLVHNRLAF